MYKIDNIHYMVINRHTMDNILFTILPFCYHPSLELTAELEASNGFYIPYKYFGTLLGEGIAGELLLYKLKTPLGTLVGTPIGPHIDGETILYIPDWMWNQLHTEDGFCMLERCYPSMASLIALEPHTSDLLKCKDPRSALSNALERYSCIQKGKSYPLQLEDLPDLLWITIPVTIPETTEPLCIRGVELSIDMLPARDAPLPVPPTSSSNSAAAAPVEPIVVASSAKPKSVGRFQKNYFTGKGNILGGK
jgi:hypothetical protein